MYGELLPLFLKEAKIILEGKHLIHFQFFAIQNGVKRTVGLNLPLGNFPHFGDFRQPLISDDFSNLNKNIPILDLQI